MFGDRGNLENSVGVIKSFISSVFYSIAFL